MKKYRLKQWYPSLYDDIEVGTIVDYEDGWIYYTNKRGNKTTFEIDEVELSYEDFWELIKNESDDRKPMTITGIMADFLDSIRVYEHESGEAIHFDERESSEFVDMYFNNGGKLKIEEEKPLFTTEDGVEVFSDIDNLFAINLTYFSKTQNTLRSSRWLIDNPSYKVFSLESNADEYIL